MSDIPECISQQFKTIIGQQHVSGTGLLLMAVFAQTKSARVVLQRLQEARPIPVDLWRTWGHEEQVERLVAASEMYIESLGAQRFTDLVFGKADS